MPESKDDPVNWAREERRCVVSSLADEIEAGGGTEKHTNWWRIFFFVWLAHWVLSPPIDVALGWQSGVSVLEDGTVATARFCPPDSLCRFTPEAAIIRAVESEAHDE